MKMKKIIALSGMLLVAANAFCGFSDFTKTILNSCNDQKLSITSAAIGLGTIATVLRSENKKLSQNTRKRKTEVNLADYVERAEQAKMKLNFDILRNLKNEEFCDHIDNCVITVSDSQQPNKFNFTETYPGLFSEIQNPGVLAVTTNLKNKNQKIEGVVTFKKSQQNYYWGRIAAALTLPVIGGYVSGLLVNKLFKTT